MSASVGNAVPRKEDRRLVTGCGRFVSALELPRMQHAAFLRSPLAHATIARVDPSAAARHPGVRAVFCGADFAGVALRARSALPSYVETDQPVLAHEKVRFAGEAVALVVARDRATAEDACELVEVEYEPLPATVDASAAPEVPVHAAAPDNVLLERRFEAGDVEAALARAALVVERVVRTNRHAANPLECRAGVALWEAGDGRLTYWCGTQVPHLLRNALAQLLGVAEGSLRVVAPDVGGGFGVKAIVYPEDVALCLAARALAGTPVKWVEDRSEHLLAAAHARDHRYAVRAGFAPDGELVALDADVVCNVGAYSLSPWTAGIEPLMAGGLLTGPYRLQHYRCLVRGVATNTAPAGPYRGVARPAGTLAMELLLDAAARRLGLGPEEIRRRNLIRPDDLPYTMPTRLVDDSGQYGRCLERALELAGYDALRSEQRRRRERGEPPLGIGIACYNELTGLGRAASAGPRMPFRTGHDACTVRVDPDGRVTVFSGVSSQGQGLETTVAQIVADGLGVAYEDVEVRIGDTDASLWGFGAFSSRQAVIGGGAARRASLAVRERVLRLAAGLLEANEADLELEEGVVRVAGSPGRSLTLAEIARVAYLETQRLPEGVEPGLEATSFYDPVRGAFAAGAQVAAVEIDRATGETRIVRWVCVEDAGTIVNPRIVEGQVAGAVAQGIGGALYEHHVYDEDGTLLTGTLADYLLPTSADVPELVLGHLSEPADNPLGVRGVGEGGTLGPAAALAGAVEDALGVEVDRLPLAPALVWELAR
ncbi:MAG TPA: xanthine dehydrogenase family protein molybdopterin-binding subunit [Gaiellaceae bacterium]|nr:xanthine dehydrogenase family protein molybdopterin-binding subunit [Gaiellaceae bacterium]